MKPIKPARYNYSDIEVVFGQDFFHHIGPLDFFHDADRKNPMAFRLPLGLLSSGLLSICFKCNAEDVELVSQVKAWYELQSHFQIVTTNL